MLHPYRRRTAGTHRAIGGSMNPSVGISKAVNRMHGQPASKRSTGGPGWHGGSHQRSGRCRRRRRRCYGWFQQLPLQEFRPGLRQCQCTERDVRRQPQLQSRPGGGNNNGCTPKPPPVSARAFVKWWPVGRPWPGICTSIRGDESDMNAQNAFPGMASSYRHVAHRRHVWRV